MSVTRNVLVLTKKTCTVTILPYNRYRGYKSSKQPFTGSLFCADEALRRFQRDPISAFTIGFEQFPPFHDPYWCNLRTQKKRTKFERASKRDNKDTKVIIEQILFLQGAATTVWAAIGKEWEGKGGKYLEDVSESAGPKDETDPLSNGYAKYVYDAEAARKLWAVSLDLVGMKDDDNV